MCGFAGMFKKTALTEKDKATINTMSHAIRHRGPDDAKFICGDNFALAFRRLSIIDLENGSQPFTSGDGRFTAVFNGEIYNYLELRDEMIKLGETFKTRSEIETLVALYRHKGEKFIDDLRGMFSIAIYDSVENKIFLGRDPFGIKPYYYRISGDGIVFASEFKAFLFHDDIVENGFSVDNALLQSYFTFQYVTEPDTVSPEVKILPAGHYMTIGNDLEAKPVQYHKFFFKPDKSISFDQKEKALRKAVEQSVEKHLLSDVPVGTFLSSGIDSAIITAVASKICPGTKAFTVAFGNVKGYSEIEAASEIAKHLDIEHIKLEADLSDFTHAFEKVVYHLDSPTADPSTMAIYLICREAAKHVKTILSGEGSDELFGGYKIYRESLTSSRLLSLPGFIRSPLAVLAKVLPDGVKGKQLLVRGTTPLCDRYVGNAFIMHEHEKAAIYKKFDPDVRFTDRTRHIYDEVKGQNPVTVMQHVDINTWLKGDILVKGDRLSMAHALEVRVPYLDKEVFEAAKALTTEDKLSHKTTKYILRHAFRDIVNEETVMRPKLGYPVPVRVWLKDELYEWARDIITSPYADEYIDKAAALKMLDDHRAGLADNYRPLWVILVFITWYRLYIAEADNTRQRILSGEL